MTKYNPNAMDEESPIVAYWKTRTDMIDKMPVNQQINLTRRQRYYQLLEWLHAGTMTPDEFDKELKMLYGD